MTEAREYRLRRGITLVEAAVHAGMSVFRASVIERYPEQARAGELERLRAAVDQATNGLTITLEDER
jgi:hypothetical protein